MGKKDLCILFVVLLFAMKINFSFSQDEIRNLKSKHIIAVYAGGRFGYSGEHLTLYSDSTYDYDKWLHTGHTTRDTGTFFRKDSAITLCSKDFYPNKKKRKKDFYYFECASFRIRENKLLLYTEQQKKTDTLDYYATYFTLYLQPEKNK